MQSTDVKVKKLNCKAQLPHYGTEYAAGADLYACIDEGSITVSPGETVFIHTGISVEIPEGLVGLVYARSGLATKRGIAPANKVGVIDSDYRGEIKVSVYNQSPDTQIIEHGERIAQLVLTPYVHGNFEEADVLSETQRGIGGFGSTGTK